MTAREDFEKIYNQYFGAVESYFWGRVPHSEVDDLTQQTFLKLWTYILGGNMVKKCKSLVFTVAKSVLVDYYRKNANTISLDESVENISEVYSFDIENVTVMFSLIAMLSAEEKLLLSLKASGYSSKEIGKRLGISASAVRSRLESIRKKLKQ